MKSIRTLLLLAVATLIVHVVRAAEPAQPSKSYLDNISVSPYATVVHHNITDGESYGAGLELSLGINPFVSISILNTGYSDNDWRDSAVDETAVLAKARLVHNESETVSLYALGGGERNWNTDDWGLSVGLGIQLRLHKNIALFGDSRLVADFNGTEDLKTRAGISLSF